MKFFYGNNKNKSYFEGWYFKQQCLNNTIAFIPGMNIDENGNKSCFIQVITKDNSYVVNFPYSDFYADENDLYIKINNNIFSRDGINININIPELKCYARISFKEFTALKYDAMGIFSLFKFMECNHGIISLYHEIAGNIKINGQDICLDGGVGYIEKDWRKSFPEKYLWAHCNDFSDKKSIVISIAKIPFLGLSFWGSICVVLFKGQEYRIATYNGAKIKRLNNDLVIIKNKRYCLKMNVHEGNSNKLSAPKNGDMLRIIEEAISINADFEFYYKNKKVFAYYNKNTSFENALKDF